MSLVNVPTSYGGSISYSVGIALNYAHLSTALATTTVKSSGGLFHLIDINTAGSISSMTIYDGTIASTASPTIAVINPTTNQGPFAYNIYFQNGLTIVQSGTLGADCTVSYI